MDIEKLHKAVEHLHDHLEKAAAHHGELHKVHTQKAEHHEKLSKAHEAHAAFLSAKHEAMDNEDVHKTYFGKAADHHKLKAAHHGELHKLHKAAADSYKAHSDSAQEAASGVGEALGKTAKAAGTATTMGDPAGKAKAAAENNNGKGVEKMIQDTTDALVTKALESLNSDPKVTERIQEIVLQRVNAALGDKIIPSQARATMMPGLRLIPRSNGGVDVKTDSGAEENAEVMTIFRD